MTPDYDRAATAALETLLNRKVRAMFEDYADNFLRFQLILANRDTSRICYFGSYVEGYKE